MSIKNTQSFYINLVRVFVVISVIGVVILIYTSLQNDPSNLAFSLIAFVISVAALVMTTLQSLSIARQVRVTEKAAQLVNEASQQIEMLVNEDRKMEREIREDLKVDQAIIGVLEEHGVGDSEAERQQVAKKLARILKTQPK
ncbi:MAG: hypothetical protein JWM00_262 [Candidatus Saccharibacteria bacterium]|nr:hypothetical protein [Candidatus Saccharibacteria bacterium]